MKTLRSNFILWLFAQMACAGLVASLACGQAVNFVPLASNQSQTSATGDGPETILSDGDVVEIGGGKVKKIPLSAAPAQLRKALDGSQFERSH